MSEEVTYNVIPLACGFVRLPTFRVHDRRRAITVREDQQQRASVDVGETREETLGPRVRVVMGGTNSSEMVMTDTYETHTMLVYPS